MLELYFCILIFLLCENACVVQKQLTPYERSEVMYTSYKLSKVKEFMQDINAYTDIQSRKNIQWGNSLKRGILEGDRTLPKSTQKYSLFYCKLQ